MAECTPLVIETSDFTLEDGTPVAHVARVRRIEFGLHTCAMALYAGGSPEANCIVSCLLAPPADPPSST